MKQLLIVAHTPSDNTQALASAILHGAEHGNHQHLNVSLCSPFDCGAETVLQQDAIILFTTENFGYMCGALKDFFERIYYPCLDANNRNHAKPYTLVIRAGLDGTGAQASVHKIITGLKWRSALPDLICKGDYDPNFEQHCQELGMTMAAGVINDIF